MSRTRNSTGASWQTRVVLWVLGVVVVVSLVISFATSVAEALAGPTHPTMAAAIAWTIITTVAIAGLTLWGKWHRRRRSKYSRLPELLALTPREFEEAVGALLYDSGFRRIERVGRAGDLCADLTALDVDGRSVVVQCKRHAPGSKIGSPDIQKFLGMTVVHHRASRGIFVTTSEFTGPARELARSHPIELWDGAYLSTKLEKLNSTRADE